MSALFLDHTAVQEAEASLEQIRLSVRRAKRWTCKAESRGGVEAHRSLHEAEVELDKLLRRLGG